MVLAGEGSSGNGPSITNPTPSSIKPKRFEIRKWNVVALWDWGIVLWISALSVKLSKPGLQAKSVNLPRILFGS